MLAKENSVTLITITKLFNVQKYLVNPSNNFPISYKVIFARYAEKLRKALIKLSICLVTK